MSNLIKRIISAVLFLPLALYFILSGPYMLTFFLFINFLIASYEWNMMTKNKILKIIGLFFLIISFYTFYKISIDVWKVLFVILICVSTDIGGYIFGKIFKGPKLTKISPNKTYAGMIGGYFLSFLFLIILGLYFEQYVILSTQNFIITFLISSVSQIGDLILSYFKRKSKIKNTGNIIPGHGGLLDRIDGMIFSFPAFYIIELFVN